MRHLLLLLAFTTSIIFAQTTVKGTVTEQNSGKKPLAGVQIKALETQPEVTDNVGLFQLLFKSKKPGDRIIISEVSKKGYEVVNKKDIENWILKNNQDEKSKIVMCPEGQITLNTAKYYSISLTAVTEAYSKRIKELQEQLEKSQIDAKTYGEKAKILGEQLINQQNQLEALADKFARENFDDCSGVMQQAFESFKSGNILEAIRILETVNSGYEIEKAKKQKDKAEKLISEGNEMQIEADSIIRQNIDKLIFQADLYVADFQFDKAEQAFNEAILADSLNFENILKFAKYLGNQKKYDTAIKFYELALQLVKSQYDKAKLLNDLSVLQIDMSLFNLAEENLYKAKKIRTEIYSQDRSIVDFFNLAETLNNLGMLYYFKKQFDKSERYFMDAIGIHKKAMDLKSDSYTQILLNLAVLYDDIGKFKKSELLYKDIILNYNDLNKEDSLKYVENYTTGLSNYAVLCMEMNEYEKAEQLFKSSITLRRNFAIKNPFLFKPFLATTLNNFAKLQNDKNQYEDAEKSYTEALDIRREFAKQNPDVYNPFVAITLNNLALLKMDIGKLNESESLMLETLAIRMRLAEREPEVYSYDLAKTYSNMGGIFYNLGKINDSELYFNESIKIRKTLAQKNPLLYNSVYAESLNNLGALQINTGNFSDSENNLNSSLDLYKELYKKEPRVYMFDLALALNNFGNLKKNMNQFDKSELNYQESLTLFNKLASKNPSVYNPYLSGVYNNLADAQRLSGKTLVSAKNYTESLKIRKELAKSNPARHNSKLAETYYKLSLTLNKSDLDQSVIYLEQAISIYNDLLKNGHKVQDRLATALNDYAYYKLKKGKFNESEVTSLNELQLNSESLIAKKNLAHALLFQNKYENAKKIYLELKDSTYPSDPTNTFKFFFLQDLDELEKAGITHPDVAKIRDLLK